MAYTTLVSTAALAERLGEPDWIVFDCRHDLARPDWGEAQYRESHIPSAFFMHTDRDLAGPLTGTNGRHPLPDPALLSERLARCGVSARSQLVAYDGQGGAFAARLWWLLRWLGHGRVAVLDGGWQRWLSEQRPVDASLPAARLGDFTAHVGGGTVDADTVHRTLGSLCLVDGRAPDRYRGENETLDPVGGRIPGALNRFYRDNLDADGGFKAPELLRREWQAVLGTAPLAQTLQYCGSGVTACHNLLALEVAGLSGSRLYAGSWSEWCADPSRPVERGEPAARRTSKTL